jgi:hypothetical protein
MGIQMVTLTPDLRKEINQDNDVGFKVTQDTGVIIIQRRQKLTSSKRVSNLEILSKKSAVNQLRVLLRCKSRSKPVRLVQF